MKNFFFLFLLFILAGMLFGIIPSKIYGVRHNQEAIIKLSCPHYELPVEYNISMSCEIDRDLDNLLPRTKNDAELLVKAAASYGMKIMVFEGKRGLCRQEILYQGGNTKRLHSEHLLGNAIDVAFLDENGKATWKSDRWEELGKLGEELGFIWGGTFPSYDPGHFETPSERYYEEIYNKHLSK